MRPAKTAQLFVGIPAVSKMSFTPIDALDSPPPRGRAVDCGETADGRRRATRTGVYALLDRRIARALLDERRLVTRRA
jgi:hypothetical protein